MVSSFSFPSFAVTKYTPQQGFLLRKLRPFSSQRRDADIALLFKVQTENKIFSALKSSDPQSSYNLDKPLLRHTSSIRKLSPPAATTSEHENVPLSSLSKAIDIFFRFIRPYAIVCTMFGIMSVSLLPVETLADLTPKFFLGLGKAMIAVVSMNLFSVSVNQFYDVELDKVNKPYLPLASGELSMEAGAAFVILASSMGISFGLMLQSPPLLCTILTFFLFGGAYSIDLPFLRWKKHPVLAVVCITAMRGLALQLGVFFHIQKYVLGKPMALTRSVVFVTIFMCVFNIAISLIKDLPDVDGDKAHGFQNMTIRFGKEKVFWGCTSLMLATYGAAVAMGFSSPFLATKLITVIAHSALGLFVLLRARSIKLDDDESTQSYYLLLWDLCKIEYLLAPFVR
uniref:Flavonoid prenyltransferase n=1 Tax=Epimedium koreanum TaxID=63351 RepID=A0A8F5M688_9MAGN|nr:flavonoid prenyltransferase [Epimedium koreanum]